MEDTVIVFGLSSQPGKFLVDTFPVCELTVAIISAFKLMFRFQQ